DQGVRQLVLRLHAHGHVRFADRENPFWFVMRADDQTSVLSRHEERVLSAVPCEYATDAIKIKIAAGVRDAEIHGILERLLVRRLIEASDGLRGDRGDRITATGLKHPQYVPAAPRARAPRRPDET